MSDEDDPKTETAEKEEEASEKLPWLENVEEDGERPPLWGIPKEMLALGLGAALVLAASATAIWVNERERSGVGNILGMPAELPPELEQPGPAAKPAEPASRPARTSRTDVVSEKPRTSQDARKPAPRPARPTTAPAASRTATGEVVQVGAYSTRARADRAAQSVLRRHFKGFDHQVLRAKAGARTVYRIHIQGEGAANRCRALRRSGGGCFIVPH